ncbi:MAG: hypothetical protein ACOY3P_20210 [Planctomycetota bacterium]
MSELMQQMRCGGCGVRLVLGDTFACSKRETGERYYFCAACMGWSDADCEKLNAWRPARSGAAAGDTTRGAKPIVTAPRLLKTCKELLTAIERVGLRDMHKEGTQFGMREDYARMLTEARNAIAEAEGGAA